VIPVWGSWLIQAWKSSTRARGCLLSRGHRLSGGNWLDFELRHEIGDLGDLPIGEGVDFLLEGFAQHHSQEIVGWSGCSADLSILAQAIASDHLDGWRC
jgi:hypothetical protein